MSGKVSTPIADFVRRYAESGTVRFHMPGHKGKDFLGFEKFDITEIKGADSLYEADGIISESEKTASELFGSGATFFSTEGSSQCVRAMLYLALTHHRRFAAAADRARPLVVAARNVHKSFVYAAALSAAAPCRRTRSKRCLSGFTRLRRLCMSQVRTISAGSRIFPRSQRFVIVMRRFFWSTARTGLICAFSKSRRIRSTSARTYAAIRRTRRFPR